MRELLTTDARTVAWEKGGGWKKDGDAVRFWLAHGGLRRGDVVLEPGELWFAAGAWGDTLGRRGGLTIKQSRLGWLPFLPTLPGTQASFIVGTFRTAQVADGDPPLGAFGA